MRQAIEEEFILDVLKHYTTYATYFKLLKACGDDPNVERKKAAKALARFLKLHPHNIAQKTEVMVDEAIRYAEASRGLNDSPVDIARACEEILLASGRVEEAYRRYALEATRGASYLATYQALARKYPQKGPEELLGDLVANTPGDEGKWFATAKEVGLFDEAIRLARPPAIRRR